MKKKKLTLAAIALIAALIAAAAFFAFGKQNASSEQKVCTLNVSCATVLESKDLDPDKMALVPEGGALFGPAEVKYIPGTTALELLQQVCRDKKIPLDVEKDAASGVIFIKGINNLYIGDASELSGWMFSVNGEFVMEASNFYEICENDKIEFLYTCDMGADLGISW